MTDEAHQLGLVNSLFDAENLMAETRAYVLNMINTVSPASLRETKRQIYTDLHRSAAEAVLESEVLLNEMMKQDDYQEGVNAFLARRQPEWKGE